jgi:hypothetical protein
MTDARRLGSPVKAERGTGVRRAQHEEAKKARELLPGSCGRPKNCLWVCVSLLTLAHTVDALGAFRWIQWMLSAQQPQRLDPGGDAVTMSILVFPPADCKMCI